jgi:hypothetical protein
VSSNLNARCSSFNFNAADAHKVSHPTPTHHHSDHTVFYQTSFVFRQLFSTRLHYLSLLSMLGLPPSTPFALTRHLLDYPIHDSASDYDQLPLRNLAIRSSPPPRPPRPDSACLELLSPVPTRAATPSWMTTLDQAAELDSQRGPRSDEEPSTPKTRPRSNSQARTHPFSPRTPSRLSLPPVTADNTDDFSPVTNVDSPYYPIYILPRRKTPELEKLARKKDHEIREHAGTKPPK